MTERRLRIAAASRSAILNATSITCSRSEMTMSFGFRAISSTYVKINKINCPLVPYVRLPSFDFLVSQSKTSIHFLGKVSSDEQKKS